MSSITLDDLKKLAQRLKETAPPKVEIWLSSFVPATDEEGNEVLFKVNPVVPGREVRYGPGRLEKVTRPRFWQSFNPDVDQLILVNEELFWRVLDEHFNEADEVAAFLASVPVYRSGGWRVGERPPNWKGEGWEDE